MCISAYKIRTSTACVFCTFLICIEIVERIDLLLQCDIFARHVPVIGVQNNAGLSSGRVTPNPLKYFANREPPQSLQLFARSRNDPTRHGPTLPRLDRIRQHPVEFPERIIEVFRNIHAFGKRLLGTDLLLYRKHRRPTLPAARCTNQQQRNNNKAPFHL